ncbi:MAG: glycoside hydrolase family 28 protein [Lachnospiraceae bacterium]|jgi:polygalacturonase
MTEQNKLKIPEASGASVTEEALKKDNNVISIADYGAVPTSANVPCDPILTTEAINRCIAAAAISGGGTVVIPEGEYLVYTIRLASRVNLYLSEKAVLRAAKPGVSSVEGFARGERGNVLHPEKNPYAGIQDFGHSYFANSMFYGKDLSDVMIYGPGLIDGSRVDPETGIREYVLQGHDPEWSTGNSLRNQEPELKEWFGNKCISLLRCRNVVLSGFSLTIGGHFAVLATGCENLLIDHVLLDTNRDALDVDACRDVTVRDSVFNSLTDDGLVLKSSYGAGKFMPLKNVLIERCRVCGYDAGSVYDKKYTREKAVATDRCGPTGRVKFGTESTCGYDLVTIRNTVFDNCRGFAMEAVDGSSLTNVIFEHCVMDGVTTSPIYLRAGDRGRFPVTGMSRSERIDAPAPNVRLNNTGWVLPDTDAYQKWPAKRYTPSYRRTSKVSVDGRAFFSIVDQKEPAELNPANLAEKDGKVYGKEYRPGEGYVPDESRPLTRTEQYLRANASGSDHPAQIRNVRIADVTVNNADPRYPILIMGLPGFPVENVQIENVSVETRGGLTMKDAAEQRQLNTAWRFSQYQAAPMVQSLPWLVNSFFSKNEGLLPRADWDPETGSWKEDPYNVPELPDVYPEPSDWGILPAYGIYARHVKNLSVEGYRLSAKVPDGRHPVVLDDAEGVRFAEISLPQGRKEADFALVTDRFRRPLWQEYLPDVPYHTETVTDVEIPAGFTVKPVCVEAPAPGTPRDSLYGYPTVPVPENGYHYEVPTEKMKLPRTVFRPFTEMPPVTVLAAGRRAEIPVRYRDPASEALDEGFEVPEGNDQFLWDPNVPAQPAEIQVTVTGLPEGAVFDPDKQAVVWTPGADAEGDTEITVTLDDGVIPESTRVILRVVPTEKSDA